MALETRANVLSHCRTWNVHAHVERENKDDHAHIHTQKHNYIDTLHRGCVRSRMQSLRADVSLMFVLFTLLSQCM